MQVNREFIKMLLAEQIMLKGFIRSLVRDPHEREDLFQEVVLALMESSERYDPARPFGPWARTIAIRHAGMRRRKRHPLAFSPEIMERISEATERGETQSRVPEEKVALQACMETLPEKSKHLLALRYEHDHGLDAISQQVGATRDAVHKALTRLRTRLRDCMRAQLASSAMERPI